MSFNLLIPGSYYVPGSARLTILLFSPTHMEMYHPSTRPASPRSIPQGIHKTIFAMYPYKILMEPISRYIRYNIIFVMELNVNIVSPRNPRHA